MFRKLQSDHRFVRVPRFSARTLAAVGIMAVALFALTPFEAAAHCDSYQGPVAQAALLALEEENVELVLPYVAPEMEAELTAAYEEAVSVRSLGREAQELADKYFVETAVRLHRMSEGASYTGVTDEPVPEPIALADEAMETGDLEEVYEYLSEDMQEGIEARYEEVVEAREHAEEAGTVEANRERVHAELAFETYIYELHLTIAGEGGH